MTRPPVLARPQPGEMHSVAPQWGPPARVGLRHKDPQWTAGGEKSEGRRGRRARAAPSTGWTERKGCLWPQARDGGWRPWWSMQPFAVGQCSLSATQMSFRTDPGPGTQATGATVTKRPGTSALTVPQAQGPGPGWAGPPPLQAPGRAVAAASVSLPSPASSLDAGLSAHVPYLQGHSHVGGRPALPHLNLVGSGLISKQGRLPRSWG